MEGLVSAILLAAGESKRMGEAKQLLPFGGSTVLEQVVSRLLAAPLDEIVVVVGCQAEVMRSRLLRYPVKLVDNPNYREGMSSSLRCGLLAISPHCRGVLIVLGDQPRVSAATVRQIIAAFRRVGKGIVAPVYRGQRGHPVLLDIAYRPEMMALHGDVGCKAILERYAAEVLEVEVESPAILQDVDDRQDYERDLALGPVDG